MKKHFIYIYMMLFCTSYIAAMEKASEKVTRIDQIRELEDRSLCNLIKKFYPQQNIIERHPYAKCFSEDQLKFTSEERERLMGFIDGAYAISAHEKKFKQDNSPAGHLYAGDLKNKEIKDWKY